MDFEDMLGQFLNDTTEVDMDASLVGDKLPDFNINEILYQCKQGVYPDISEGGSVKCYKINSDYVLVARQIETAETAQRLKKISPELKYMGLNVHTVVDYTTDGEYCYELQSRAKGEIFKHRDIESSLLETIDRSTSFLNKGTASELEQKRAKLNIEKAKRRLNNNPIKSRKDEYIRRCTMLMQMSKEHIIQYFDTIVTLSEFYRIGVDTVGEGNLLYDSDTGFNFIDINFFEKPNRRVLMDNLLDIDNSDTMTELIGIEYINDLDETDKPQILILIRNALKKIICSIKDSKICNQKITAETIKSGLESYKKYGINITLEEIMSELHKDDAILLSGIDATKPITRLETIKKSFENLEEIKQDLSHEQNMNENGINKG